MTEPNNEKPLPGDDEDSQVQNGEEDNLEEVFLDSLEPLPGEDLAAAVEDIEPGMPIPTDELIEPVEEAIPKEPAVESKTRRFFRKAIRWTIGLLIVFGLGLLAGIFLLYRPAIQEAENSMRVVAVDLADSNQEIADLRDQISGLEAQIAGLQPLKTENEALLAAQDGFNLHIAILNARLDVTAARLALSGDESARALITLEKTADSLERIGTFLEPEQRDMVTAMVQRLDLVLSEIENDPYAAQSDLDVLATNLLQLEDALFSE